jgi:hypothetical protein
LVTCFREIGHQVLGKIAFLTQTTLEIKTSAIQIASTVLSLSLELSSFRLLLLSFGRPPVEEYFMLEDAMGRTLPIHLRTITSWEALAFVLSERFKGRSGSRRVQQKRYRLLEHATRREIVQGGDWKRSFSRYQKIDMSLLCKDSEPDAAGTATIPTATCPWCKTDSHSDTSTQVQWYVPLPCFPLGLKMILKLTSANTRHCNMFFTRVVEIDDMILPPKPSHPREIPRFGQPSFNVPIPPERLNRRKRSAGIGFDFETLDSKRRRCDSLSRKRPLDEDDDYESDEAEVHGLVRVTVVTRRKKIKVFHPPTSGSLSAAPVRENISNLKPNLKPTSSQAKMRPKSSSPLQIDEASTAQDQALPPTMPGLWRRGGKNGQKWLGVNDYSFLPYQSLMAQRAAEYPYNMDWDAVNIIFE